MSFEIDRRWSLTRPALELLLSRLGDEPEAAGREYDRVRGSLTAFFKRRGLVDAEALADEAIDRVARRLQEGETIEHLNAYFYGVAKLVAMERLRKRSLEKADGSPAASASDDGPVMREARVVCLESCLNRLPRESRSLIVSYYQGGGLKDRQRLADALGLTYTNLKTRAHRIRNALSECLKKCLTEGSRNR